MLNILNMQAILDANSGHIQQRDKTQNLRLWLHVNQVNYIITVDINFS